MIVLDRNGAQRPEGSARGLRSTRSRRCARRFALRPRPLRLATPTFIASAAVALGATVASDCLLQPFFDQSLVQRIVGAIMAALFGVAGTRWALSRGPSEWNALRGSALTGSVVLSWFMVCDRLASLHASGAPDTLGTLLLPLVLVVVAALGAMVGTLFGLTAVAVVRPVERGLGKRSLDAPERALLPASVWLGAWGVALVSIPHPRSLPALALVGLGLAGLGFVAARDAVRLRFLKAVFAGVLPGLRVVRPQPSEGACLAAYGPHDDRELDGAIVPVEHPGGPYRASPPEEPLARIPLSPTAARRPFFRRLGISLGLAAAMIGLTVLRIDPACLRW